MEVLTLLLDTHVLLWWFGNYPRVKTAWAHAISQPDAVIFVSIVSLLEIVLKTRTGKLRANLADIERLIERNRFTLLAISTAHLIELERLPIHHGDPFDHLLIAQAISEGAILVSDDRAMKKYPVQLL